MTRYLADIEITTFKLVEDINRLKDFGLENEILQAEFLLAKINNWIKSYHDIIF